MKVGEHKFNKFEGYMNNDTANFLFSERTFFPAPIRLVFIVVASQIERKYKILLKTVRKCG